MLLCNFARVHQATFGGFGVALTLGVREDVHHLLMREGAECCLELFEAIRGGTEAAGVLWWGNRVESARWWLQGLVEHLVDEVCGHRHQLVSPPELPCCRQGGHLVWVRCSWQLGCRWWARVRAAVSVVMGSLSFGGSLAVLGSGSCLGERVGGVQV